MLGPAGSYQELFDGFRWRIPARFSIGTACLRHAPAKTALLTVGKDGDVRRLTFGEVDRRVNRLANVLLGLGLLVGFALQRRVWPPSMSRCRLADSWLDGSAGGSGRMGQVVGEHGGRVEAVRWSHRDRPERCARSVAAHGVDGIAVAHARGARRRTGKGSRRRGDGSALPQLPRLRLAVRGYSGTI